MDKCFQSHRTASRPSWFFVNVILAFCLLCVLSAPAMAVTYSNTTPGTLDGTCLSRTFAVTQTDPIADVDIGLVLDHGRRGQIQVSITNPAGMTRSLISGIGGNLNDLNVLFDDEAAAAISTHNVNDDDATVAAFQRTFRPAASLTSFDGVAANGNWVLQVCD